MENCPIGGSSSPNGVSPIRGSSIGGSPCPNGVSPIRGSPIGVSPNVGGPYYATHTIVKTNK